MGYVKNGLLNLFLLFKYLMFIIVVELVFFIKEVYFGILIGKLFVILLIILLDEFFESN